MITLLWPRRSASPAERRVFGGADVAASVVAAVGYGFANYTMDGPGGRLPPDSSAAVALLTISVFTATLAVLVLGAAVGVLLDRTHPALISTLRISAGVLLLVCSTITTLAVASTSSLTADAGAASAHQSTDRIGPNLPPERADRANSDGAVVVATGPSTA